MKDRPVKQSPELDRVEHTMRPMYLCAEGFLGKDPRKLIEILTEDQGTVNSLGLSHGTIAQRLKGITERARSGWGDPVVVEDKFEVEVEEARGKIPCPWGHPGLYPKTHVKLKKRETGEVLIWSDLSIHLIEEHGFYQGKGSTYRLDPPKVKRILEI
ncbi:MAG: hypothetical protein JSW70_00235 [Syntrophobacterales bacterium]|nr:MAG: hypothetical protein JSW70_00235 [Syntrophobacterales bacterium]